MGLSIAKAMAISLNKPLVAVNHLEGHALSPKIIHKISFPYLLLLISGGHTQFLEVSGIGKYKRLGTTIDDAVGEAFDKTARLIGIKFPGGPQIESFAEKGDKNYFKLPKPILNKGGCNLSFAGLKTAVLKISKNINSKKDKYNLAASFQNTIENILYEKSKIAMSMFKENNRKVNSVFVIAGGVASNKKIRNTLKNLSIKKGFKPIFPPINLCSDNAAMIAWAGIEKFKLNLTDKLNFPARARWPLDENAPFMKGAGVKL